MEEDKEVHCCGLFYLRYFPSICMEGLTTNTETHIHKSWFLGLYLKLKTLAEVINDKNFCMCRQFRDAARERYFKNMNMAMYFHSAIADYYLGIWGGGNPKPFKYTEIQRHRYCHSAVIMQMLALTLLLFIYFNIWLSTKRATFHCHLYFLLLWIFGQFISKTERQIPTFCIEYSVMCKYNFI